MQASIYKYLVDIQFYLINKVVNDIHKTIYKFCMNLSIHNDNDTCIVFVSLITHEVFYVNVVFYVNRAVFYVNLIIANLNRLW